MTDLVFRPELPAVYLDALVIEETTNRLVLINRNPEPDERNVRVPGGTNEDVILVIADTDAASPGVELADTRVYLNGFLAYDGASGTPFQVGYDGSLSAVTTIGANQVRIAINVAAVVDWYDNTVNEPRITVRVVSASTTGGATLDESYSFTLVDVLAPKVVQVVGVGHKTVRVTFDEDVKESSASGTDDALNPANYTLSPTTLPAVTPVVVGVTVVSSTTVELTTNIELTQGATYLLIVTDVVDLHDNATEAPYNQQTFVAYSCPLPQGRSFDLFRMLPLMNRREDTEGTGDLRKFILCLQEITDLLLCDVDAFADILDPDLADEQYVDAMLADLGNPFNFELSLTDKRLLIRILVPLYRQKGTEPGVKNVVRFFLGLEVSVTSFSSDTLTLGDSELGEDWILGPSGSFSLYAFDVEAMQALTTSQRSRLRALVNYMKPAHTHFQNLVEPIIPEVLDHLELGLSELGDEFVLH